MSAPTLRRAEGPAISGRNGEGLSEWLWGVGGHSHSPKRFWKSTEPQAQRVENSSAKVGAPSDVAPAKSDARRPGNERTHPPAG
jgi:hypothetical protein